MNGRWLLPHRWVSLHTRLLDLCSRTHLKSPLWLNGQESSDTLPDAEGIVLPFVLSSMPDAMRYSYLAACLAHTSLLIIADYRLPERNLDFPAYGLTAGVACGMPSLRGFLRAGGIEGVIHTSALVVQARQTILCGAASVVVCSGEQRPAHSFSSTRATSGGK